MSSPQPTTGSAATAPSRCFICLGDAGEEGDPSDWVHPCPCSLEAHHACLLQWVDECEREGKALKCPVCQAPIHVEGARDFAVDLSDRIRTLVNSFSPIAVGSMFGGAVMAGQALYGFHAVKVFAGDEAVLGILGSGRLRESWPALLGVPFIAPGLVFWNLLPGFTTTVATPFSILYSATFLRSPEAMTWPPAPQLAFASLPCIGMVYIKLKNELFGSMEARWDRAIRGLPEAVEGAQAPQAGVGGLRDIINNFADGLQGGPPEDDLGEDRVEIWFDERDGQDGAELVIDLIEEIEVPDEEAPVEEIPHPGPGGQPADVEPRQDLPQQEAEQGPRAEQPEQGPAPGPAAPLPDAQRRPAAVERAAVRYSIRDLTSTILGALFLPSVSFVAGELLRLALPKAWTSMPRPPRSLIFSSPYRLGPTGLLQERWGRSLVGGCAYVVLKDMFRLYVKYRRAAIRPRRRVPDATPKQRLALAICDFLTKSTTDGTVPSEDAESIEVAVNCIADSFKVDASAASSAEPLLSIFTAHEASRPSPAAGAGGPAAPGAAPTAEQKKEAEALKSRGNAAMAAKDYAKAIELYTEALALHPGNAVFLSNRAAAHSAAKDHESARADAEAAVDADPSYTKAWSRLGLARFALGDAKGSMEAYGKGIEYEGNGGSEAMKKGYETARRRVEGEGGDLSPQARGSPSPAAGGMPDFGGLASMLGGGAGGAGGAAGMDFASILSNPMFQNMAQGLMSNPDMMASLMNNPRLREMANQMGGGGGGGMPDLSSLMADPNIAELARTMMGGAGAPPGGNSGASGNPGGN
ncbi:uncharacterized protein DNG_06677 [Cephalotrichum gorgonifer]|uniref:RING-CH-type domain-containing protein n=1 Tax=Cephalotrichum gorgonifer TaxID=2041049 RepID=A0AAE8N200_9PEZI|nr:uncharacterized protein DNG_06677 [Cephalotrichum gorgonifer]